MREIQSLQHPLVKHLTKLRKNRRYRESENSCLVSSSKIIREIDQEPKSLINGSPEVLAKISGLKSPPDMVAEYALPDQQSLEGKERLLILDGIQDPGNLGTLIRTALAMGWDGLFLTPTCCDPFNEKALQASRGAIFRLPYQIGKNPPKGYSFLIAQPGAPLGKAEGPVALVLGSEGQGPSKEIAQLGDPIGIPMPGEFESLNVAVAGAILIFCLSSQNDVRCSNT